MTSPGRALLSGEADRALLREPMLPAVAVCKQAAREPFRWLTALRPYRFGRARSRRPHKGGPSKPLSLRFGATEVRQGSATLLLISTLSMRMATIVRVPISLQHQARSATPERSADPEFVMPRGN